MTIDRIEAALRKLPISAENESVVQTMARFIALSPTVAESMGHPIVAQSTRRQAVAELIDLAKKSAELREHIFAMRKPAQDAINDLIGNQYSLLDKLQDECKGATMAATLAAEKLLHADDWAAPGPQKRDARLVTDAIATAFRGVTGQQPRIHSNAYAKSQSDTGPFIDLLTDCFKILGVDASPSGQARLWKKNAGK